MRIFFIWCWMAAALMSTGRGQAAVSDAQRLAEVDNDFAFKLLKQISKAQPNSSIFISPCSVATVLQMTGSGAGGATKSELDHLVGVAGWSNNQMGTAHQLIERALNPTDTNIILNTANAIWYRQGAPVQQNFLVENQRLYGAVVAPLDFADSHAADVIDDWARAATRGKIDHIGQGLIDPVNGRLILANAIYFKAKWLDPFEPSSTEDRPFYPRGGGEVRVPMMSKSGTFTYRRGTGYQAVRLPYLTTNLAMYVFLPDTNSSPEHVLGLMSGDVWRRITRPGFKEKEGMLQLPRFKVTKQTDLVSPLQTLGLRKLFDPDKADLSGIAPQLYVSAIRQQSFIDVKEEGTEAAVVTAGGFNSMGVEMPPVDPFQMVVDRPFLFLIEDSQTGVILFMGIELNPATTE